jgi:hypothetical protein
MVALATIAAAVKHFLIDRGTVAAWAPFDKPARLF